MLDRVTIISQWESKPACRDALIQAFEDVLPKIREYLTDNESVHLTSITHDDRSPSKPKYDLALILNFNNFAAFDAHRKRDFVINFINTNVDNPDTAIASSWCSRIFKYLD